MLTNSSYLSLSESGELARRVGQAYQALCECRLCPRDCGVNRLKNKVGICRVGKVVGVASANLHFGEEPPISGTKGSGTIFFTGCNMRCQFCQNYPLSQMMNGKSAPPNVLAEMMLNLQKRGAHNINLVTASHVVPQFLAGLCIAAKKGLNIPIVYNCSGYDGLDALKLLDGVIDIYMPDIKYTTHEAAKRCSGAPDYWDHVRPAVKEMFRQVGNLELDENGIAKKGLLIRHLVLPGGLASSDKVFEFVATELSRDIPVNLMSQYFPADRALNDPLLCRKITKEEFEEATSSLHKWGITNGWIQYME